MKSYFAGRILVLPFAMLLSIGCAASKRVPLHLDSNFRPTALNTIAILPVVDRRSDLSVECDLRKRVHIPTQEVLADKGYEAVILETFSRDGTVNAEDVAEMDEKELTSLLPGDTDAIAIVYLEDLRSGWQREAAIFPCYEFSLDLTGKVVSKTDGVVWYDKATATKRSCGLLAAAVEQAFAGSAYGDCVESLFSTLPSR